VSDILAEILHHKRGEVGRCKRAVPPDAMRRAASQPGDAPRGFRQALLTAERPRVVAELKRRSPSKGEIRPDFDPVGCAQAYAEAGAAAISVLTDEKYFGGRLEYLKQVRAVVAIPLLRKDFVVDCYQVDEARAAGADAVLLIVRALERGELAALRTHAASLGMDALVEVHDETELRIALDAGADLVGINNRDLRTFTTDLAVSERLAPPLREAGVAVVGESGIFTIADIERLEASGADAVLVGEALMRQPDVGRALKRLRGKA